MRVAVVHDWLVNYAGAERVLQQILLLYPDAHLFSLIDFLKDDDRSLLSGRRATTSFIQRLPFAKKHYRRYLPLMPLAIEQFDMSGYDLVISSSHAIAKGILTGPDQLHISYIYSPIRYAWDLQHQYLRESGLSSGLLSWVTRYMLHRIRIWDMRTAAGVDAFVADSHFIARRIRKVYRRDATVIYPPVDIDFYNQGSQKSDFYLAASRMVPYKRMPLIVEAFNRMPDRTLIMIGDGPEFGKAKALAHSNVKLLGHCSSSELRDWMQRARAFVFAAEEDFGITPLEAQACGTPVIAFRKGGVKETVLDLEQVDNATGVFFAEQSVESIIAAVQKFETNEQRILPSNCRANAERFSPERFGREFHAFVMEQLQDFSSKA